MVPIHLVDEDSVVTKFQDDPNGVKTTLDFICSKKELGVTIRDLNLNCENSNLSKIIKHLVESKIVVKTGLTETRYVSQKYCTPWLLNSFKMTRLEREKVKPNEVTAVTLDKVSTNESDGDEVPKKKMKGVVRLEEIKSDCYIPPAW